MCLTQSLFPVDELNLMCYVDDPLAALRGDDDETRIMVATIILVWEALKFPFAYPKGQFSNIVTWVGGTIDCGSQGTMVTIKESILEDIRKDITEFLSTNVISRKKVAFRHRQNQPCGWVTYRHATVHGIFVGRLARRR